MAAFSFVAALRDAGLSGGKFPGFHPGLFSFAPYGRDSENGLVVAGSVLAPGRVHLLVWGAAPGL
jgi:hypothetical protein